MYLRQVRPYLKMVFNYPLHLMAAFFAALISNFLFSLGPKFVKVFVDQAQLHSGYFALIYIALFFISSLLLAFYFDTIEALITHEFKLEMENYLRKLHFDYGKKQSKDQKDQAQRRGIFGLVEFTHLVTLESFIIFSNIFLITFMIILDDLKIGLCVFFLCIVGSYLSAKIAKKLGKISRYKEYIKQLLINTFDKSPERYPHVLSKLQRFEHKRFFLETLNLLLSFFIFQFIPAMILLTLALKEDKSLGQITSYFLYFGLLHRPFSSLTSLYKNAQLFYEQSSLFRNDLELAIKMEEISKNLPFGIISLEAAPPGTLFVKKNGTLEKSELKTNLDLKEISKKCLVMISAKDIHKKDAHFYVDSTGKLVITPLARLKGI